jgi:NitT/TauT family transport system permease protein
VKPLARARRISSAVFRWAVSLGLIWLIWQFVLVDHINTAFFASPAATWDTVKLWFDNGTLGSILAVTLKESLVGLAIGVVFGLILGLVLGLAPLLVGKVIEPVVVAVYAAPKLAIAPILFVALGPGFTSRVLLVVLAIFPIIAIYTVSGVRTVDPDTVAMMRRLGASSQQIGRKLMFPQAAGYFVTALLYAAPHAITVAIGAEILFGSNTGIGGQLYTESSNFDPGGVLGALVVGTILGALLLGLCRLGGDRLVRHYGFGQVGQRERAAAF